MWHAQHSQPAHLTSAVIAIESTDDDYPKPLLLGGLFIYRNGIGWQCETTDDPLTAGRFWWASEHDLIALIQT